MKQTTAGSSIQIVSGRLGWILKVNGMYIHLSLDDRNIKAIKCDNGIPHGPVQFVSIPALRKFWHLRMPEILHSTGKPYKSEWGSLIPLTHNMN